MRIARTHTCEGWGRTGLIPVILKRGSLFEWSGFSCIACDADVHGLPKLAMSQRPSGRVMNTLIVGPTADGRKSIPLGRLFPFEGALDGKKVNSSR